ncbi:MAG: hypothetical protein Q8904_03560 [Bacteroidota bacterium]|nr:hypothetical protein [Bacteroidota bacterium]
MSNIKKTFLIYALLAMVLGIAIAWLDSQPNWDNTGITVFLISGVAALFGFLSFERPWIIALAVSMLIPARALVSTLNQNAFLALAPGFAGAYTGYPVRRAITKN